MDRNLRIVLFFLIGIFFLHSCAQLGTIEGGAKDEFAPKIVEKSSSPANGTINFTSKTIELTFDEYFTLNNPEENISILPTDVKIKTKVEKKKLILELEGDCKANTTYQISFNNAIKDLNEGNDSLMHYVFSTGDFIDSLTYTGKVGDGYSGELQAQILVALYPEGDSIQNSKPIYFTKTDKSGDFQFSYLKAGKYDLYAFQDQNKDLKWQTTEKVGFKSEVLSLDSSLVDSSAILVFPPKAIAKITSKSFIPPNQIKIGSNQDLRQTAWKYKDTLIETRSIYFFKNDSIALFLPDDPKADFNLSSEGNFDTLFFRVNDKKVLIKSEFFPSNKTLTEFQNIKLMTSALIKGIDSTLILFQALDSSEVKPIFHLSQSYLEITFSNKLSSDVKITFLPNAIHYNNGQFNDTIRETFLVKQEKEFGSMIFLNANLPSNSIVEILSSGKVIRQVSSQELSRNKTVAFIEGGEYSFRIIRDENQNGKWDGGDVLSRKQAEEVLHFPQKVKVRANWETEVELDLKEK